MKALNLDKLYTQFLEEREMLKNVTPKSLRFYRQTWSAFKPLLPATVQESDLRDRLKQAIIAMKRANPDTDTPGKTSATINAYLRGMNAFTSWLIKEQKINTVCRMDFLKTEQKVRQVYSEEHVRKIIRYKPWNVAGERVWVMAMTVLDCGLRLNDVRTLKRCHIDFENFLVTIELGKGRKQRLVPFSGDLRKILFKYVTDHEIQADNAALFTTRTGSMLSPRNADRDLRIVGNELGIPALAFHRLRHTMATNYLKHGGVVTDLRRILGHATINTTMIYEHLQTSDMVKHQQTLSILSTSRQ